MTPETDLLLASLTAAAFIILGLWCGHRSKTRARWSGLFAFLAVVFILAYILLITYYENYVL